MTHGKFETVPTCLRHRRPIMPLGYRATQAAMYVLYAKRAKISNYNRFWHISVSQSSIIGATSPMADGHYKLRKGTSSCTFHLIVIGDSSILPESCFFINQTNRIPFSKKLFNKSRIQS